MFVNRKFRVDHRKIIFSVKDEIDEHKMRCEIGITESQIASGIAKNLFGIASSRPPKFALVLHDNVSVRYAVTREGSPRAPRESRSRIFLPTTAI